jgi:hypothetical protein
MNRKIFFLGLIGVLAVSLYGFIPVCALASPCGWSTIPMSDPADDVWQTSDPNAPWTGNQSDFHDEIDLIDVNLGAGLQLEFQYDLVVDGDHVYSIYIDLTGDGSADYFITSIGGAFYITRQNDSYYWNGTSWGAAMTEDTTVISLHQYLQFPSLPVAIPDLPIARFAVTATYVGDMPTTYYQEYWPNDPSSSGIPGFAMISVLFSILTLLGLLFLKRQRTRIL